MLSSPDVNGGTLGAQDASTSSDGDNAFYTIKSQKTLYSVLAMTGVCDNLLRG